MRAKQDQSHPVIGLHTLVNGRSSSVMRSKREDVWCILGDCESEFSPFGGWLGECWADENDVEADWPSPGFDSRDWVDGLLKAVGLSGLAGSSLSCWCEPALSERRASVGLDWRFRMTGSEMLAMTLWVLSRAATARERMLLEVRWWRGTEPVIETELAWRRGCETGGGALEPSR